MMKKDENLIFIMVLLFMVSMFGYNGQRSWGEKITPTSNYLKLDSVASNQKEWIDSSLLTKPGTEIVEKKKKQRKAVSFFFYLIKSLANKNESANFLVNVGHLYVIINDIKGR